MNIDLTPLWTMFKILVVVAIAGLVFGVYQCSSKTEELVSKKRIEPKLIIEQKKGKSDTTFVYSFDNISTNIK